MKTTGARTAIIKAMRSNRKRVEFLDSVNLEYLADFDSPYLRQSAFYEHAELPAFVSRSPAVFHQ